VAFSSAASSGTVQPSATTTYGVRGTNAGGTGALATATVTVTAATPTCNGGTTWNGTACACPAGQVSAEGQCYTPAPASTCGVERWAVKTASDPDVAVVNFAAAIPTTVATLQGLAKPPSRPASGRLAPVERSVYALDATLTMYRMTEDSDYHLVVADSSGRTMIVELPHPDCVANSSPVRAQLAAARDSFNGALRATSTFKTASIPVRIHGVGFMDSVHGQTGVAPNGVELHPVLNIEFNPKATQAADPAFKLASDSDRLFNWAEQVYPQFFSGAWIAGVYNEFTYRYYAATGNYVATSTSGRVVVHNGRDWVLLDVGALSAFMPGVAAAGY
jgi:hypothetical protein